MSADPFAPSDDQIIRIVRRVQEQLRSQVRLFRIECVATGVTLHGLSRTFYAKQLAQHFVMKSTKLPIVANQICVESD
ncbi:MAG: hypothetical protein U0793_21760 [Gemmataceae bacterium]